MTDDLKAAFINAHTAMMNAELEGMIAENAHRLDCGNSIAYGADAFAEVRQRFDPVLGHNALLTFIAAGLCPTFEVPHG